MQKLKNLSSQLISNFKATENITKAKRDLILSILKSTTTKREAKNYLRKYQNHFNGSDTAFRNDVNSESLTNLQNQRELFVSRFLQMRNPFVSIYQDEETKLEKVPLRIALVKLSLADETSDTWRGIAETFKRLVTLGISPVIVLGHENLSEKDFKSNAAFAMQKGYKLLQFLTQISSNGTTVDSTILRSLFLDRNGELRITSLEQLLIPLYQGIVPIVQPVEYVVDDAVQHFVNADDSLYAISAALLDYPELLSVEKVIIIDKLGGIPSIERNQTSHVFINLSQEYSDIVSELFIGFLEPSTRDKHLSNLNIMDNILTLATEKSNSNETTGLITTPEIMSLNDDELNPIVYNVLTDRPIISSSLPSSQLRTPQLSTSILKKGFEVVVLDQNSYSGHFNFENLVSSNLVDDSKLYKLLNDSFQKELDINAYAQRINERLATIIIVGDYDGAAIITWETLLNGDKVAYLDKFAVSSKNQGLPSLADIIFKLISRSHQSELLWRSRKTNPVNKWYFDRCRGSFSGEKSAWKLFYTGEIFDGRMGIKLDGTQLDQVDIKERLLMYAELVERIEPSFVILRI